MNDSGCVRSFEGHGDLNSNTKRLVYFYRITPQALSQRLAFNELSGYIESGIGLSDLENGKNVGMIKRKYCPGFLFEPADPTFVFSEFWWQNLERYFAAVLLRVFSQEDFPHPTLAQPFENAIMSNCGGNVAAFRRVVVTWAGHGWEFLARDLSWRFTTMDHDALYHRTGVQTMKRR